MVVHTIEPTDEPSLLGRAEKKNHPRMQRGGLISVADAFSEGEERLSRDLAAAFCVRAAARPHGASLVASRPHPPYPRRGVY
jgi:hypothetical protein